jgi:CheY-like chemotaxis protein/two-component sensor histidine kinase
MRMKPLADPQLTWSRDIIDRQLAHLTRLVDDLLDVSRITRGKINLSREPIELATFVARAVETVHPLIKERGHELTLEMPEEVMRVNGDPLRLTQALGNVLSNAAKYTEKGGRITLSACQKGRHVEIRVRDTGIGIPAALLPRIFDMFTQLDHSFGRPQGGLGIGLALVRKLLEMHGGTVTAYSEGDGFGSEFLITLPLLVDKADAAARPGGLDPEDRMTRSETNSRRRILVADDNVDALESLATLLELGGHEVFSAANGALALESAERHLPEVALLDIGMPKLDGYEVARRIRAQPWGRRITLVALTGWGQDSDRRRSGEAGFDSHLVKPLDLDKLTELLARLPNGPGPGGGGAEDRAASGAGPSAA